MQDNNYLIPIGDIITSNEVGTIAVRARTHITVLCTQSKKYYYVSRFKQPKTTHQF